MRGKRSWEVTSTWLKDPQGAYQNVAPPSMQEALYPPSEEYERS